MQHEQNKPPIRKVNFGIRIKISAEAEDALRLDAAKTRRPMGHIIGELLETHYAAKENR